MTVIKVSGLSKRYRIGIKEVRSTTLFGSFVNFIKTPLTNFQKLQRLNSFTQDDNSVFWALKDIDFQINQGEVLGIIGKNGAGKSTLLKILSQITEPTFGKVEIHGRVASLLEVGTGFHPELSGRENIYMNGTILGMSRKEIDKKFEEIVDFSGVEKFIDTPVKFYSSGMKVRLGFSVAAHLDPEILIIDEVLAVGDYDFQKRCIGKMEEVSKGLGRTVLFVSHQLSMISSLCTRTILLENGTIKFDGETNVALSKYLKSPKNDQYINFLIEGNESILISFISVFSNSGKIYSLRDFNLKISYISHFYLKNSKARIDVRIDDVFGNGLIWMSTSVNSDFDFDKLEALFSIEKLQLISGEYFLTIYFHDGVSVASHYSRVQSFFVTDSPYFEEDLKIPGGQTSFIVPFKVI